MKQLAPAGYYFTVNTQADYEYMVRKLAKEGYRKAKEDEPVLFELHFSNWQKRFTENWTK